MAEFERHCVTLGNLGRICSYIAFSSSTIRPSRKYMGVNNYSRIAFPHNFSFQISCRVDIFFNHINMENVL